MARRGAELASHELTYDLRYVGVHELWGRARRAVRALLLRVPLFHSDVTIFHRRLQEAADVSSQCVTDCAIADVGLRVLSRLLRPFPPSCLFLSLSLARTHSLPLPLSILLSPA